MGRGGGQDPPTPPLTEGGRRKSPNAWIPAGVKTPEIIEILGNPWSSSPPAIFLQTHRISGDFTGTLPNFFRNIAIPGRGQKSPKGWDVGNPTRVWTSCPPWVDRMSTKRFAEEFRRILGNRRGGGNREGNPKGGVSDVRNPWIPMNFHDLWGFDTCRDPCRCQKPTRTPRRIPGIILGQALSFLYKNEMDF